MKDSEIFVETGDRGKPPFDCPVGEAGSLDGKPVRAALPIRRRLLALDEGKNIGRGYFCYRLLDGVQEDLEIIAIAYPGIEPAAVLEEFEIGIYLGHSQRDIYNLPIHHLPP